MCSPSRYSDMVHLFAKRVPVISMITNEVLDFIYATHGHRIQQWNHQLLRPRNLEHYADSVYISEHPLITASGLSTGCGVNPENSLGDENGETKANNDTETNNN